MTTISQTNFGQVLSSSSLSLPFSLSLSLSLSRPSSLCLSPCRHLYVTFGVFLSSLDGPALPDGRAARQDLRRARGCDLLRTTKRHRRRWVAGGGKAVRLGNEVQRTATVCRAPSTKSGRQIPGPVGRSNNRLNRNRFEAGD